jgi:hypothetical protein
MLGIQISSLNFSFFRWGSFFLKGFAVSSLKKKTIIFCKNNFFKGKITVNPQKILLQEIYKKKPEILSCLSYHSFMSFCCHGGVLQMAEKK